MSDLSVSAIVIVLSAIGFGISNLLVDRGVDSYTARRIPAALGGFSFLLVVQLMDALSALILTAAIAVALIAIRLAKKSMLRGVEGTRVQPWVDVTFVVAGAVSIAVGWIWLGDRWLAFVPIGFMAWGDTVAATTSLTMLRLRRRLNYWPSVTMLAACLTVALIYDPYWIAALAAVGATVADRFTPTIAGVRDDNWVIVGVSLVVLGSFRLL